MHTTTNFECAQRGARKLCTYLKHGGKTIAKKMFLRITSKLICVSLIDDMKFLPGVGIFYYLSVARAFCLFRFTLGKRKRPAHYGGETATPLR